MPADIAVPARPARPLGREFNLYWLGLTVSNLGNSFSQFAFPLLIYKLTASAINLGLATAAGFLPYLLFGLLIGAWADRLDRKRMMVLVNLLRGLFIASIPLLAASGLLWVGWLYLITFINATLNIFNGAGAAAATACLVDKEQLVQANGRITAAGSTTSILGPLLAGVLVSVAPVETIFWLDSLTFVVFALALLLIKTSFNRPAATELTERKGILGDIKAGLSYLWSQPVLLSAIILATAVNFIFTPAFSQQVILVKEHFRADDAGLSLYFASEGAGAVLFSVFVIRRLPPAWTFGRIAIGTMLINGVLVLLIGSTGWFEAAVALNIIIAGCGVIFNVQIISLAQKTVPDKFLGRVITTATVLAFSAIPLGALAGGFLVEATGRVGLVYQLVGGLLTLVCLGFLFTPLNRPARP